MTDVSNWQDVGYVDETGVGYDLLAIQAKINRDIASLAAMTLAPAIFREPPQVVIEWGDPVRRTLLSEDEARELLATNSVAIQCGPDLPSERYWLQRWICGVPEPDKDEPVAYDGFGAPLYAHQLPPEGTE